MASDGTAELDSGMESDDAALGVGMTSEKVGNPKPIVTGLIIMFESG